MGKNVLLVGEPMGLFIAEEVGLLESVGAFSLATCGAELNVAIGLKRLEHDVTYMTKLGDDLFGRKIAQNMVDNGISTEEIKYSSTNTTGFMFKSKVTEGDPSIAYFRKGSAASTLSSEDVEDLDYHKFDIVHLTGITPALTDSTRAASNRLNELARHNGCFFSFDPNLRPQLWPSKEVMADYINHMAFRSDLFLPGIKEADIIMGSTKPEEIAEFYLRQGTGTVVVKLGAEGAFYADKNGKAGYVPGFKVDHVVDTVGAGDGFAAGVLSALRENLPIDEAVRRGCAIGAIQVMSKGDNDGLPTRQELADFMADKSDWRRL